MANEQKTTFEDLQKKISEKLQKAKQEFEELSLQFNLGKSEAADKFEELKKDFNEKVGKWKIAESQLIKDGKEKASHLKVKLEELQVQLSLGKAEAKDLFHDQKKKIMQSISELEREFKQKF